MLELTRRMTPARSCFDRIAGAYINDCGEVDESFNIHFGKLSPAGSAVQYEPAGHPRYPPYPDGTGGRFRRQP